MCYPLAVCDAADVYYPHSLARLTVTLTEEGMAKVSPQNVRAFAIHTRIVSYASVLVIGGQVLPLRESYWDSPYVEAIKGEGGIWKVRRSFTFYYMLLRAQCRRRSFATTSKSSRRDVCTPSCSPWALCK